MRAPLKALDRLLGNRHLHVERERLYAAMGHWLVRGPRPVIVVDWSDLKADRSRHVLRAAVPVGGRTLTFLDMVFAAGQQGSPQAEKQFLHRLAQVVPPGVRPILVTDAGFRAPWFRAVEAMGWYWVGRLRHRTHVKPLAVADSAEHWVACKALYPLIAAKPRDLGWMEIVRTRPLACRMVLHTKPLKGRKQRTRYGVAAQRLQPQKRPTPTRAVAAARLAVAVRSERAPVVSA